MGLLETAKNFIFGDSDTQRDKVNASNWANVNTARSNYEKALAYQSALSTYFEEHPDEDSSAYSDILSDDFLTDYSTALKNAKDTYTSEYTKNRWNEFGSDGLINDMLNPLFQTASAGANALSSLNGGESDNWSSYGNKLNNGSYRNSRDLMSDLGAAGETALTIATLGSSSGVTAGTKSLGKTVAKGALTGAAGGLTSKLREDGSDADLGSLALSTISGGIIGGGVSGLGYKINEAANNAKTVRNIADAYDQAYANASKSGMNTNLLSDGVGGTSANTARTATEEWLANRGNLAKTKLGQAYQGITDKISYGNLTGQGTIYNIKNSNIAQTTSNLLKTKAGKVGAGVAGGLLLTKLLNNGSSDNSNDSGLTDEELQELYNYYSGLTDEELQELYNYYSGLTDEELQELYNYYYGGQ